jgi:uncharacterized protein
MRGQRGIEVTALDGARLLVDHHRPRGEASGVVVWMRTPYGRKGVASIARRFARSGAHVIVEAMRGSDGSDGAFDPFDVRSRDATAVLNWLRCQPWFDGVIATWGVSALGYLSWALTEVDVPEWRLAILQDAPSELREDLIYPGGIFAGKVVLGFLGSIEWQRRHWNASLPRTMLASVKTARRVPRALSEPPLGRADERLVGHCVDYFQHWLEHEHDDAYWHRLDRRQQAVAMPMLVHLATGWYDVLLASTVATYRAVRDAGKHPRLVIGPWYHGRGVVDKAYRSELDTWLVAARTQTEPRDAPVRVYVGGIDVWRDLPDWPPPDYQPTSWHLHADGELRTDPAPASEPDRYRYDPARPTPSLGGAVENFDGSAGAKDNRPLEQRPDVLTYTSAPLTDDLEVIGPVTATIAFRSSLAHTDVTARLCDVAPEGRSVNLCDGARRLRPGATDHLADGTCVVPIDLVGVAHVFRAGHRIRLQVSSGAHPRLVRNHDTGEPLATATELRPAEQEVWHDPVHVSTLTLPVSRAVSATSDVEPHHQPT